MIKFELDQQELVILSAALDCVVSNAPRSADIREELELQTKLDKLLQELNSQEEESQ